MLARLDLTWSESRLAELRHRARLLVEREQAVREEQQRVANYYAEQQRKREERENTAR